MPAQPVSRAISSRLAVPFAVRRSYRTYNEPAHFGHSVWGVSAETVALHREQSNSLIFGMPKIVAAAGRPCADPIVALGSCGLFWQPASLLSYDVASIF